MMCSYHPLIALLALSVLHPALALSVQPQPRTSGLDRRHALRTAFGVLGTLGAAPAPALALASLDGYDPAAAVTAATAGRQFFPPLTPPLTNRATYRYELGRGAWALEQLLSFANVSATIRTVVVRMSDGSLWVHSPQWPTGEFCALLEELGGVRSCRTNASLPAPRRSHSPLGSTSRTQAAASPPLCT